MTETIKIRMAGYGPATTGFSKSLKQTSFHGMLLKFFGSMPVCFPSNWI